METEAVLLWRGLSRRVRGRSGPRSMRVATRRALRRAQGLRKATVARSRRGALWVRTEAEALAASERVGAGVDVRWTKVAMGRWAAAGKEKSRRELLGRAVSERAGAGRGAPWTTAAMVRWAGERQSTGRGLVGGSLRWTAPRQGAAQARASGGGGVGAGAGGPGGAVGRGARARTSWAVWRSRRSTSRRTWIRRSARPCSGAGAMGSCSVGRSPRRARTSVGFTGARGVRTGA